MGIGFICSKCNKEFEAWDEGNPYYFDEHGEKQYAYHPDENRDKCIGIDSEYICLQCGNEFMVDSLSPISQCPKCGNSDISDIFELEGKQCPYCKVGKFEQSGFSAIS